MEFNTFPNLIKKFQEEFPSSRKMNPRQTVEYWDALLRREGHSEEKIRSSKVLMDLTVDWIEAEKPYYNVWPSIIDNIENLDLSKIPTSCIKFPVDVLCIKLPTSKEWFRTELVDSKYIHLRSAVIQVVPGKLRVLLDDGRDFVKQGTRSYAVELREGNTLEAAIKQTLTNALGRVVDIANNDKNMMRVLEFISKSFRLIAGLGLLSSQGNLVTPDLLTKDRGKEISVEEAQARAKKKGMYGWSIGKDFSSEQIPHVRKAHLALYWTGEKKTIPVIKMRTGENNGPILVHKKKLKEVPTGFEAKEQGANDERG